MTAQSGGNVQPTASMLLIGLALAKLTVQLVSINQYGIFRDEMYYLACSRHLAWGYVDQPPLIAVVARLVTATLGDSLVAIRLLPALAGSGLVLLTGLMARRLGGGRFAQALAALAVIVAPSYLFLHHVLTMNGFEPLFWMGCVYVVIVILQTRDAQLWLWFGLLMGVGLLNKHSIAFFAISLVVGLLLTPQRALLRERWIWTAGALAFLIFLPHLVWQVENGFPQLEILRNVQGGKNYVMSPLEFLSGQIVAIGPMTFPIWIAGLCYFLFSRAGRAYRALGRSYLVLFVIFIVLHGKFYYMLPVYPMLLASGSVFIESLIARRGWNWLKPVIVGIVVIAGAAFAPLALPLLPVETYVRYARAVGIDEVKMETHKRGSLPQVYADMFGWENMVATVAGVYHHLPADEQPKAAIFTRNYGQAGAIDFYAARYGLPNAISGHNNYFLWGPRGYTGEVVIVIGGTPEELRPRFEQVEQAATIVSEYAMPYETDLPVWVCHRLRGSLQELWPGLKRYE